MRKIFRIYCVAPIYRFLLTFRKNSVVEHRWVQRFQNYQKAFSRLEEALAQPHLNELERNGLVQRFKFTLDLAWKVMKDFLLEKGFSFKPSPKETIRLAAQSEYIQSPQALIDGLDIRNELSHDYSGEKFEQMEKTLRLHVFPALEELKLFFESEAMKLND
ncbi:MAG: HI0074 family nucleotidyltransferase substrate-binding subunit [Chitinophagales bacterium]|nr:HI0074 family nucleotidyltransferase substrate-binding subunit [Chitinophagales bacterium]